VQGGGEALVEVEAQEGRVLARPLGEGAGVRLNEVQLTAPTQLRSGDELALGDCRATLVRHSPPPRPPGAPRPAWQLEPWLEDAVAYASRTGTPLVLAELPPGTPLPPEGARTGLPGALFTLGAGGGLLAARWEAEPPAGALRFARFPGDGVHAAALLGRVLGAEAGGGGEEAPVVREPVMVRLSGLLEQLAARSRAVLLQGEPGVGRALWARRLLALRGVEGALELAGGAPGTPGQLARVDGARALLVEEVHLLRAEAQDALAAHPGPLVATAALLEEGGAEGLRPALAARLEAGRLVVPPLRDRPAELPALVEAELVRLREGLGRPGLQLDAQARTLVLSDAWPGNVDALKAALWRAARVARGEAVRPEDLPLRLGVAAPQLGMAAARAVAERSALLSALGEAGWNVSEAARRMGLPRRTLVHRMSVLGVRRPARR
jgi:hypothetical protein